MFLNQVLKFYYVLKYASAAIFNPSVEIYNVNQSKAHWWPHINITQIPSEYFSYFLLFI